MQILFGLKVNFMRFLWGFKQPQTDGLIVDLNLGQPFFVFSPYATKTASVSLADFLMILRVLCVSCFAQVFQTIVRSIAVYMVYLLRGPLLMHIEPRQAMRIKKLIIQPDNGVAVSHPASGFIARSAAPTRQRPSKNACFGVVSHKGLESVVVNVFGFHALHNIKPTVGCQA